MCDKNPLIRGLMSHNNSSYELEMPMLLPGSAGPSPQATKPASNEARKQRKHHPAVSEFLKPNTRRSRRSAEATTRSRHGVLIAAR
jgi:hypothetical protein